MNIDINHLLIQIQDIFTSYGLRILTTLGILIIGRFVAGIIRSIIRRMVKRTKTDPTIAPFIENMIYIAILAFTVIAALSRLGVETTSFIAVIGAAGLAIECLNTKLCRELSNFLY